MTEEADGAKVTEEVSCPDCGQKTQIVLHTAEGVPPMPPEAWALFRAESISDLMAEHAPTCPGPR